MGDEAGPTIPQRRPAAGGRCKPRHFATGTLPALAIDTQSSWISAQPIPLCVDLDGTLIRSDMLFESALGLLRRNPLYLFAFALWLARGRAHLKREIARRAQVDPTTLPYDERVVSWYSNLNPGAGPAIVFAPFYMQKTP